MVKPFQSYLVQEKYFKKINDYVIAMQAITSNSSDHKKFSILTGKFASGEVLPAGF